MANWQNNYQRLQDFFQEHGHPHVPKKFTCADGFCLGAWASSQRSSYRRDLLPAEQIQLLEEIPDWSWGNRQNTVAFL